MSAEWREALEEAGFSHKCLGLYRNEERDLNLEIGSDGYVVIDLQIFSPYRCYAVMCRPVGVDDLLEIVGVFYRGCMADHATLSERVRESG